MKSKNRLKSVKILEGQYYQKYMKARYPSGRINYNEKIYLGCDNKYIEFIWDTGNLIMRLDKFLELPKKKRDLIYRIK